MSETKPSTKPKDRPIGNTTGRWFPRKGDARRRKNAKAREVRYR